MGNFAVDVMWRLGIGIDSRKGTRVVVIYACSWDPLPRLYSASLCSLLDRLHLDLPTTSLIFSAYYNNTLLIFFLILQDARSFGPLWTTHATIFFLLIG